MNKDSDRSEINSFFWITAFVLANLRGTVIWDVLKQALNLTSIPWIEVFIWLVLSVIMVWSLLKNNLFAQYLRFWRQNWILALFIAVAILSLLWSVSFFDSLYRSMALLFSSLIGAYIGTRYSLQGLLNILFRFGTFLLIICFVLALFSPVIGAMNWEPYNGAWRGVFWHKNQFGAIAALFGIVFLVDALDRLGKEANKSILSFVFYLFTGVVIYFSKSVAGYFLYITMSFCTLLAFFWLKARHQLKAIHYYAALGLGILIAAFVLLNLDFVFGLFNRDTSLTGRLPLWSYLINNTFAESPWVGHGFGALWSMRSFRLAMRDAVGWGFPVVIADNGFLDILLHVGLLGFIPFFGVLVVAFIRSGKFALQGSSLVNFFPLLLMVYAVEANISFSLFLETETFVWLVMVASLFIVTRQPPSVMTS